MDEQMGEDEDEIKDNLDWFPNTPTFTDNIRYRILAIFGQLILVVGIILLLYFLYTQYGSDIGI